VSLAPLAGIFTNATWGGFEHLHATMQCSDTWVYLLAPRGRISMHPSRAGFVQLHAMAWCWNAKTCHLCRMSGLYTRDLFMTADKARFMARYAITFPYPEAFGESPVRTSLTAQDAHDLCLRKTRSFCLSPQVSRQMHTNMDSWPLHHMEFPDECTI